MENQASSTENSVEQRRHTRVNLSAPVQYKNLRGVTDVPAMSVTRNLCEGGVCFQTSKFISLACRLVVEISIPNSPKPIKAISKVAWIRKLPYTDLYELGNQFLEITKEDKANILKFVSQNLSPAALDQNPPAKV